MTAELVLASNVAQIEALDPQAREVAITRVLSEARSWLAIAVETSGPAEIADFRKVMATIEEATRQMNLSKEIQLDATEMVRRSERAVGQSIRKGQEQGTVLSRESSRFGQPGVSVGDTRIPSPYDFVGKKSLTHAEGGIYDMTDGVSDQDFEVAIEIAKEEKNLSRANVVRTIKGTQPPSTDRPESLRGTRRLKLDLPKALGSVVNDLESVSYGLKLIQSEKPPYSSLPREEREEWASTMRAEARNLNRNLSRFIKELTS